MTGEGTRDVDLPQEWLGGHTAGLRVGGDGGEIKGQRRIDDGDGDATIGSRCSGACGDIRHMWLSPQNGCAGLWGRGWDGAEREEPRQGFTLGMRNRQRAVCHASVVLATSF